MALGSGFKRFFRLSDSRGEIDEELAFHIDMKTEELVASGITPEAARAEAVERLGDVEWVREECRGIRAELDRVERAHDFLETLRQDVRYALRLMARKPSFAAMSVAILALGVGANTAMFGAYNDWTFRGHPAVEAPDELVAIYRVRPERRRLDPRGGFGHLGYLAYKDRLESFAGLTAWRPSTIVMNGAEGSIELSAKLVSADYFEVLGVRMELGRSFLAEEGRTEGTHPVAVVSHDLWTERLGAPGDLSRVTIRLNDREFQVVGVAPEGFGGIDVFDDRDLWIPLAMERALNMRFPVWNSDFFDDILLIVGRLRAGVGPAKAQAEVDVVALQVEQPDPSTGIKRRLRVDPRVRAQELGNIIALRRLIPIAGASLVLLLVACVNVSGLVLVRMLDRKREIAFRLALGAGRGRIVRQLLTESVILAVPAGVLSLLAARLIAWLVGAYVGPQLDMSPDYRVLAFAVALAALATLALGLAPAVYATRFAPTTNEMEGPTQSQRRPGLLTALVVGQLAATLLMLAGAGSFVRTLQRTTSADLGFESDNLITMEQNLRRGGYTPAQARAFYPQVMGRISELPGVMSVAVAATVPRFNNGIAYWSTLDLLREGADGSASLPVEYNEVGPQYFETMGTEIVSGRGFALDDDDGAPHVAVVNETLAEMLWGDAIGLGERVRVLGVLRDSSEVEIVGVVEDTKTFMRADAPPPEIFVPVLQSGRLNLVVLARTQPGTPELESAIQAEAGRIDASLPPAEVRSMNDRIEGGLWDQRMWADLSTAFAFMSLLLATVGLYTTVAFAVAQRTKEFGIRLALGARRLAVLRLVVGQGMRTTATGVVIGLAGSYWLFRVLATYVYVDVGSELSRTDPWVIAACVAVLCAATVAACLWPARKAIATDPMATLRYE